MVKIARAEKKPFHMEFIWDISRPDKFGMHDIHEKKFLACSFRVDSELRYILPMMSIENHCHVNQHHKPITSYRMEVIWRKKKKIQNNVVAPANTPRHFAIYHFVIIFIN